LPRSSAIRSGTRDAAERKLVQQIVAGHGVGKEAVERPEHRGLQFDQPAALPRALS
jgi:hypothetical protein